MHIARSYRGNIVADALRFYDGTRYHLHAFVVMPNHVHTLITPLTGYRISRIVQSIKGFSAKKIIRLFGGGDRVWQPDYYDRMIRNEDHFMRVVKYIEWNPVKAKLCFDPGGWVHGSAYQR